MIRIDEIYNNTIWPWIQKNRPGFRMFMCDPFGRSDPDSVKNYGHDDIYEHNYIFFFDQEPIHLNIHIPTFEKTFWYNLDLSHTEQVGRPNSRCSKGDTGYLITSEKDSVNVTNVCKEFNWIAV